MKITRTLLLAAAPSVCSIFVVVQAAAPPQQDERASEEYQGDVFDVKSMDWDQKPPMIKISDFAIGRVAQSAAATAVVSAVRAACQMPPPLGGTSEADETEYACGLSDKFGAFLLDLMCKIPIIANNLPPGACDVEASQESRMKSFLLGGKSDASEVVPPPIKEFKKAMEANIKQMMESFVTALRDVFENTRTALKEAIKKIKDLPADGGPNGPIASMQKFMEDVKSAIAKDMERFNIPRPKIGGDPQDDTEPEPEPATTEGSSPTEKSVEAVEVMPSEYEAVVHEEMTPRLRSNTMFVPPMERSFASEEAVMVPADEAVPMDDAAERRLRRWRSYGYRSYGYPRSYYGYSRYPSRGYHSYGYHYPHYGRYW